MSALLRSAGLTAAVGVACAAYGSLIERNAFTLRTFDVPVLAPGSPSIKLLHLSDLHLMPNQRRKQAWIRDLATLAPDLVVNTGDHLSSPHAVPAMMRALEPLLAFPGAFVPGNNDYFAAVPKSPSNYFKAERKKPTGAPIPWPAISAILQDAGWLDLTHSRLSLKLPAGEVAFAGTDDPYLRRADYALIAGPADPSAMVRIGAIHSPEPELLQRFANDGYDLVLAGHTHGGQVRIPFGPAITTNCGIDVHRARWLHAWDERMWFHVCAGLGTSPYMPIRFACRPEASLLRLVSR